MARDSFCDRPQPGVMPTRAWVSANRALVEAISTSQARASSKPPVMATPLIAPITGLEKVSIALTGLAAGSMALAALMPRGSDPSSFRSSPAVKARSPAPVRMATRTSGSASRATKASARAARRALDMAFIASGRLRVTVATPSAFSTSNMVAPPC